jgi:glucans biosynthesis protein
MALALAGLVACEAPSVRESTLPSPDRVAKVDVQLASDPPSAATLEEHVLAKARALAARPYVPVGPDLPARLAELDYEGHRSIQFRREAALGWAGTPFQVHLRHRGYLFPQRVNVYLVDEDGASRVPFDAELFDYLGEASTLTGELSTDLGFGGLSIHYPLNDPARMDEVVVFQGASYFRLVGPGQVYGVSSRGVAIDVAREGREEFPAFKEFWLLRPKNDAASLVFHALLDGPSLTGAYRFELEPGDRTVLAVDARLFARRNIATLGVAPLSSMFLYDANSARAFDDFRPQVHDSDGLMMLTRASEWIWRPLSNRRVLRVSSLRDRDPRGFGLAQRARDFDSYLDLEAQYHRRPSQWVRVLGAWGEGGVELAEIPTESEFNDNIAAYWVPDEPFLAGRERRYRYELVTFDGRLADQTLARVARTRIGWDGLPGQAEPPPRTHRRFVIDFVGGPLTGFAAETTVEAVVRTTAGETGDVHTRPLPDGSGWRASFRLEPESGEEADMQLFLLVDHERVSETWSYVWYPSEVGRR